MNKQLNQKEVGELKEEERKIQSDMQSSSVVGTQKEGLTTSDMSDKTATQTQNLTGSQNTNSSDVDEETSNAWLIMAFAEKLKGLVFWKKLELADGKEVFALCFPTNLWITNSKGELVAKK